MSDSDTDAYANSIFFPSGNVKGALEVSSLVARGSGYKSVVLVYTKSPESVKVYLDTNDDGVIGNSNDELLYTATLTSN
jgi:hypothetical protein